MSLINRCMLVGLVLAGVGCGGAPGVPVEGHVTWGGQPHVPKKDELVRIVFHELRPDGLIGGKNYETVAGPEGAFKLAGIHPSKYRVAIACILQSDPTGPDQFYGRFTVDRSPYTFDIAAASKSIKLEVKN